jgi:protein TonB
MAPNNSVIRTALAASLAGHCLLLWMPGLDFAHAPDPGQEDVHMTIELEEPLLLPEVDRMGDERKLEEMTELREKQCPEPDAQRGDMPVKEEAGDHSRESAVTEEPASESMLRYRDMVKGRIEKTRRYPAFAQRRGIQGMAEIEFLILFNGRARDIRLVRSSGSKILDREAVRTIRRAAPFPPVPGGTKRPPISMRVAIMFSGREQGTSSRPCE